MHTRASNTGIYTVSILKDLHKNAISEVPSNFYVCQLPFDKVNLGKF